MKYFTSDGSYYRVEFSTDHWTVYLPDGGRVEGNDTQSVTDVYDRNGNRIHIARTTPNGIPTTTMTDDLGRTITLAQPAGGPDTITEAGYGANLTWTVVWRSSPTHVLGTFFNGYVDQAFDIAVPQIDHIEIPSDGPQALRYSFGYLGTGYGIAALLNQVTLPSGATTSYIFGGGMGGSYVYGVTNKQVSWTDHADGGATVRNEPWTFSYRSASECYSSNRCTVISHPDGGVEWVYYRELMPSDPLQGLVVKTVKPSGELAENMWRQNRPFGSSGVDQGNPFVAAEVRTVATAGAPQKSAVVAHFMDWNGNETVRAEYDWIPYSSVQHDGSGGVSGYTAGTILHATGNTYSVYTANAVQGYAATDSTSGYWNPSAPRFRNLLTRSVISNTGAAEFTYDTNGNATQERHWDSTRAPSLPATLTSSNATITGRTFDSHGNLTGITDPRGIPTCLTYDANNLYPTQVVEACGTGQSRTWQYTWDFPTGLVTRKLDADNNVATDYGYDTLGRPALIKEASGIPTDERRTAITYEDSNRRVVTRKDRDAAGDGLLVSVGVYDELNRPCLTRQLETSSGNVDDDTVGIKVQTRYFWGTQGNYNLVSNPFRAAQSSGASGESTMGWTLASHDQDGRAIQVQSFGGATLPAPWGNNSTTAGTTITNYSAETTTVTDPGAKVRLVVDGVGRLKQVVEDPNGLNYSTSYTYNALDDLTQVTQGTQTRTFIYDSLKRLSRATNPESGIVNYTYDLDGNLLTKTDARNVIACFGILTGTSCNSSGTNGYDNLNRPMRKQYSDGTPNVSWTWDTVSNAKGQLASVSNSVSTTTFVSYDKLWRPKASRQTTGTPTYLFGYAYNREGLTAMTYPSTRVVSQTYDGAGRVASVSGLMGTQNTTYASSLSYAAHGALSGMTLGNGIAESHSFNSRLQQTGVTAGSLALNFYPCDNGQTTCSYNNGNIWRERIQNAALTAAVTEEYRYDALNRLKTATEGTTWKQTYVYDRFGNRTVLGGSGWQYYIPGGNWTPQVTADDPAQVTAQFTGNRWISTNVQYDNGVAGKVGNITALPGYTFVYDAENRMVTAKQGTAASTGYVYDGEGRRVEKLSCPAGTSPCTPSSSGVQVTTTYVYDATGQLAAEYAASLPQTSTNYLIADHLGSTRMMTSASGTVISLHDYLPFGEEIPAGTPAARSATYYPVGSSGINDGVTEKFTGKERDVESMLDYFGARYLSSAQGRFTTADDPLADQWADDPQSWNLYIYARNNPLTWTDPTGNAACVYDDGSDPWQSQDGATAAGCAKEAREDGTGARWVYQPTDTDDPAADANAFQFSATRTLNTGDLTPDARQILVLTGQKAAPVADPRFIAQFYGLSMIGGTVGVGVGTLAGGTGLVTLGVAAGPLLPAVPSALEKLQKLGMTLEQANAMIESPTTQKLIDNLHGGNINVLENVGEKVVRVTLDPTGKRIISAGLMRANSVTNGIASGRFTPLGK